MSGLLTISLLFTIGTVVFPICLLAGQKSELTELQDSNTLQWNFVSLTPSSNIKQTLSLAP